MAKSRINRPSLEGLLKNKKMSMGDLSHVLGKSKCYVSYQLNKDDERFTDEQIKTMCFLFDVNKEDLIFVEPEPEIIVPEVVHSDRTEVPYLSTSHLYEEIDELKEVMKEQTEAIRELRGVLLGIHNLVLLLDKELGVMPNNDSVSVVKRG